MENWIQKAKDDFLSARRCSKNAPENESEPYKEKYRAKEIFETLLTEISVYEKNTLTHNLLSALFHYEIGVICLDTEEPAAGEVHLTAGLTFLENYNSINKYTVLFINIYNQLGILWSVRKDLERALGYLKEAEKRYTKSVNCQFILSDVQLFSLDETEESVDPHGERELNKAYAHTLYYLAQVYGNLEDAEQAAMYCYKTLKWQIDHKLSFDPMEWSLNAAVLSEYFATKDQFNTARHLLSCSSFNLLESTEKEDSSDDKYQHTKADVQRCWGKYGLALLTSSKQRLNNRLDNNADLSEEPRCEENKFTLLDCDLSQWENKLTDKYVNRYEDARSVFLHSQNCFNEAKLYYTLNDFASDYITIVQNVSELYKALAFFEPSFERACKMFKRRADLLEDTLNTLNIKYYLNPCRQLRFELADIYSEMMDMKLNLKEKHDAVDRKTAQKINMLIQKSLHHFSEFVETVKENQTLPSRFNDDLVRPALLAHFYMARLHSKLISSEPEIQLQNLKSSDDYYQFVANYIKKNPDHEHFIKEELDVISEMLKLLPQRIQMLARN